MGAHPLLIPGPHLGKITRATSDPLTSKAVKAATTSSSIASLKAIPQKQTDLDLGIGKRCVDENVIVSMQQEM